ncbi:MAG: hypothetical protein NXI22_23395 [bacterium]|nr:hypothetical protein [bacterium]
MSNALLVATLYTRACAASNISARVRLNAIADQLEKEVDRHLRSV